MGAQSAIQIPVSGSKGCVHYRLSMESCRQDLQFPNREIKDFEQPCVVNRRARPLRILPFRAVIVRVVTQPPPVPVPELLSDFAKYVEIALVQFKQVLTLGIE
jgi:hypothetical protein